MLTNTTPGVRRLFRAHAPELKEKWMVIVSRRCRTTRVFNAEIFPSDQYLFSILDLDSGSWHD
jgi:hypothetical protein